MCVPLHGRAISTSTTHVYVEKLRELGVPYANIAVMGDDELEKLLFPDEKKAPGKPLPDFVYLSREMTKKGVTLTTYRILFNSIK